MNAEGRLILLRRPAVLHVDHTPFVPQGDGVMDDVDHRWKELCEANPAYFDGAAYHVIGVHRNGCGGASVHVCPCSYRFFAVQDESFDLGVRPLGVKGMTWSDGRILLGRRSRTVASYQGLWEFAPAGGIQPGREPIAVIRKELSEEAGVASIEHAHQVAIVFDPVLRCWEVICRLELKGDTQPTANSEYDDLEWFDPDSLPEPLSPVSRQMTALL